jgi:hypothetical protein
MAWLLPDVRRAPVIPPIHRPDTVIVRWTMAHSPSCGAGQFQHLTSIGVAGAGGVLVLLQAELIPAEQRWWLAIVLFAASAVLSVYGQIAVVDGAFSGHAPGKKPRALRGFALACLGAAGGAALATVF